MPAFSDPQRWVIPALLLLAVIGLPFALVWERIRPSVPAHVAEMRSWRRLSTAEQAAADDRALREGDFWAHDAEVRAGAEQAARLAVERASRINALYHP